MKHLGNVCVIDKEHATKYGVNGAIFLSYIFFWLDKNRDANRNYRDGKFWTYNSVKSLLEYFPFWSEKQLRKTIRDLEKQGAIEIGVYNKMPFDRTRWYTLGDVLYPLDFRLELTTEISDQICETQGNMELPKRAKGCNYSESQLPPREVPFAQKGKWKGPKGQTNTNKVPVENPVKNPLGGDSLFIAKIKDEWGYRDEDIEKCLSWVKANRSHLTSPLGFLAGKIETMKFVLNQIAMEKDKVYDKERQERIDRQCNEEYRKQGLRPLDYSVGSIPISEQIEANQRILEANRQDAVNMFLVGDN